MQKSLHQISAALACLLLYGCDQAPTQPKVTGGHTSLNVSANQGTSTNSLTDPKRQYAGSASCKACHERFYKLWEPSNHGKAMQAWTPELANKLPEHTEPIEVEGNLYQAFITPKRGWVTENKTNEFEIIYTLGGKNYYNMLSLMPDGRLQVLPIFYDVAKGKWRNTTMSMLRHFNDGTTDTPLEWRDPMLTFNAECFRCHVSQSESNYDPTTDTYNTTWQEAGISCESCHGPCSEHIRVCEEAPPGTLPENLELIGWWEMNREARDSACAGCHTKGAAITDSFDTSDRYWDHYDLTTFEHGDYYSDGRDLGENYTMGGWELSLCVKSSEMSCTDCHTSSGRNKFKDAPDKACLPCHKSRVSNIEKHSHHKNLNCVDCHMPMNPFGGMNQSDHSMRPPLPQLSEAVGSRNACVMCHEGKTNQWALDAINEWHPGFEERRAFELERALLVEALSNQDWSKMKEVHAYIKDPGSDPMFVATMIRQLPASNDPSEQVILRELVTDSEHPLVRAAASAALDADNVVLNRTPLFKAVSDEYRLVRVRAAERLAALPATAIPAEYKDAFEAALKEMWNTYELRLDHWSNHFNAGNIYMRQQDLKQAASKYDRAHELRDDIPLPLINSSMAHAQMGDLNKAEERLIKATQLPEPSAEAHFNLGLLYSDPQVNRMDDAEKHLYESLEIWPENARAAFNLGLMKAGKDYPECFRLLNLAIELDPNNSRSIQALAFYYLETKQADLAKNTLEKAMARGVSSRDIQVMYQQALRAEAGQ